MIRVVPAGQDSCIFSAADITCEGVADDHNLIRCITSDFVPYRIKKSLLRLVHTDLFRDKNAVQKLIKPGKAEFTLLCNSGSICYCILFYGSFQPFYQFISVIAEESLIAEADLIFIIEYLYLIRRQSFRFKKFMESSRITCSLVSSPVSSRSQ